MLRIAHTASERGKVRGYGEHRAKARARRDGVRGIGTGGGPRMGNGVDQLLKLVFLNICKKQEKFLVKASNNMKDEMKLGTGDFERE